MKIKIFDGLKATPEYTIQKIAKIVRGDLSQGAQKQSVVSHLLVDSRLLLNPERTLFFAIETDRRDGHDYIDDLIRRGARNFIVTNPDFISNEANFILVSDAVLALQKIASHHRQSFDFPIWAITGSNGKTTVKEWLYRLIKPDFVVGRSPMSYNSQIGVPLSVWGLNKSMNIGLFECGISSVNQMSHLAEVVMPTAGIFLNITDVHSSGFSSDRQKAEEKVRLFEKVDQLVYCRDHELIHGVVTDKLETHTITWGKHEEADLNVDEIRREGRNHVVQLRWKGERAQWLIPFYDEASVQNALHAATAALVSGIEFNVLSKRIKKLRPVSMRLEQKNGRNRSIIIDDAYSNDFTSLRYALGALAIQAKKRRVVIISSFEQLALAGEKSIQMALTLAQGIGVHLVVGVGGDWMRYLEENQVSNCIAFESTADLAQNLSSVNIDDSAVLVKGARRFKFEQIIEALQDQSHQTRLEVNLGALINNFNALKGMVPKKTKTMVMLKALSYGVGDIEVSRILELNHADYFGVAYSDEGKQIRSAGLKTPIMVMNADVSSLDQIIQYQLEPVIYSIEQLHQWEEALNERQISIRVHLNIDTGMHRLGIDISQVVEAAQSINKSQLMVLSTVYSHLHGADDETLDAHTHNQAALFNEAVAKLRSELSYSFDAHLLNSAGIQRFPQYAFDMVRMGIGLYGVGVHSEGETELFPVVSFKSQINQIRKVKAGETVGYGNRGVSDQDRLIATVPVGYADGLRRSLGEGKTSLYVNDEPAPIVGSVCMDMVMLDVTQIEAAVNDSVVIFDNHHDLSTFANQMNTIPYEVLTSISSRVKRVYLYD